MTAASGLAPCPGCGALLNIQDGPVHRYMISSPACWASFGTVLAGEYSNPDLLLTHRLSVDTYAVQHPGDGSPAAAQSVGLHLARLLIQLEAPSSPRETNKVMLGFGRYKAFLPTLSAPKAFSMTVADVVPYAATPKHAERVRAWALAVWHDWADQHEIIRAWLKSTGQEPASR